MVFYHSEVTPSVKYFVKPKAKVNPISRTLKIIFIFFHIICAFDFGFIQIDSERKRRLLKLWSLSHSLIFLTYACYAAGASLSSILIWLLLTSIMYFIYVIVLLSNKYTYYDFLCNLDSFDREINATGLPKRLDIRIISNILIIVFYIIIKSLVVYKTTLIVDPYEYILEAMFAISTIGIDFVRITYFLVFSVTCWRITKFIEYIKKDNVNIVACQSLYKNIADITEKIKANFDIVFIVTLLYNTVAITVEIFLPFADGSVKSKSPWVLTSDVLTVVKNLLIVLAPAFTAGLLSSEVEKLVLALRDKILVAKGEKQILDIKRFIGYIEARPMKFFVCGVVPLDWNLPVTIVNISFTYLIVMIQFTHKY